MKKIKITDLEKFALEQIVRPYQTLLGLEKTINKLPYSLDKLAEMLNEDIEWSRLVIDRIKRINFYFPPYIKHKILNKLKE